MVVSLRARPLTAVSAGTAVVIWLMVPRSWLSCSGSEGAPGASGGLADRLKGVS